AGLQGKPGMLFQQSVGPDALGWWVPVAAIGSDYATRISVGGRDWILRFHERMTDSLREQEQMLSSIAGNIADGIYRSTPDKGMVYANEALARMFGYTSAAELMNVAGPILYANPRRRQELTQLLDDVGHYRNEEVEYQRKDGTRFFAVNSATTVKDDDGEPIYFDGVISDITERKRAEAQVY